MKIKKLLSAVLVCAMVFSSVSLVAFADDSNSLTFAEFIKTVADGNGEFDGKGITVEWSPVSGCFQHGRTHDCTVADTVATAATPNRVNANLAQYQIFEGLENVRISNVNFKYDAADFTVCANSGWGVSATSKSAPTAQLHMYNRGNVTLEGCTFDNVVATPWNYAANNVDASDRTVTVENCTFKNIPGSYGLKDVQAATVTIADNHFEDTRSGIMLSGATAKHVKISGNTFSCDPDNDLIQIAENFKFDNDSDMTVSENTSKTDAGVFRMENKAVKNVKVINNVIPESASYTSKNSKYTAEVSEDGSVTSYGWDGAEGETVEYNGNYYKTLAEAVKAVYMANDDKAVLNCKKGAYVGQLSHVHVSNSITINGNGAKVTPGGDQDLEIDTYYYNRKTGSLVDSKNATADDKTLDRDITVTINNLSGIAVWGERHSEYTVNVVLNDCTNLNRIYISGAKGTNNYTLNNCTFDSKQGSHKGTSVYSNNPGTINVNNCSFKGISLACNFNNKSNGAQNITISNCEIVDCATEKNTADDWKSFTAPVRFVTSGDGAKTTANVKSTSISYTEGNKNVGNGDILLGEGRENEKSLAGVTLNTENVDAEVQVQYPGSPSKTETVTVKADTPSTVEIPAVAAIGSAKYSDLASAFANVKKGDTITLLKDVTLDEQINIRTALDGLTLDGNGHTITTDFDCSGANAKSALYFGNATDKLYVTGVKIKDLKMRGSARFAIFLCGGTSTEFTNVDIQGDYYIGVNLYGTHGATFTDSVVNTTCTTDDDPGYICAVWSNVAAANPLRLVNSQIGVITINEYTTANTLAPKIFVDNNSKTKIHTFDNGSVSKTRLMCLSASSTGDVTVQECNWQTGELSDIIVPVASVGDIYYESLEEAEAAAAAAGKTVVPYTGAEKVSVVFEKSESDSSVYDICVKAEDKIINRLTAAEFAFELTTTDDMYYDIEGAENVSVKEENGMYLFNFNGVKPDATGTKIKIGTVKFGGFGKFSFAAAGDKNIVNATKTTDNIITSYVAAPSAANEGTLDTSNKLENIELKPETAELTVNVKFNNPVGNQIAKYQDMKVTVSGGDLAAEKTFAIGSDENAVENGMATVLCDELTKNIAYTVTVSGAGYRTARHTVTMNDDKTLTFWNNVLDNPASVEEGKTAVTKNFLAGDIVKDNKINIYDLSAVVSYYGRTNDTADEDAYAKYDLNRDGVIDSKDVAMVLVSWGN